MKKIISVIFLFLVTTINASTPQRGILATNIQLPISIGGKAVGSVSLKTGSEIIITKVDSNGVFVTRGEAIPIKVSRECISEDSLALAEATPTPLPSPSPTPTPNKQISADSSNNSKNDNQNIKPENVDENWKNPKAVTVVKVSADGVSITTGEGPSIRNSSKDQIPSEFSAPLPSSRDLEKTSNANIGFTAPKETNSTNGYKFESLHGTWTQIQSGYFSANHNLKLEIQSKENIVLTQEFNYIDGTKNINSTKWKATEEANKIKFDKLINSRLYQPSVGNYKDWYEIRVPFNLYKLELTHCWVNSDGNSGTSTMLLKKMPQ